MRHLRQARCGAAGGAGGAGGGPTDGDDRAAGGVRRGDVCDAVYPPGYGRLNDAVREAMAMAGLSAYVRCGRIAAASRVLFIPTGGQPARFAYADRLGTWLSKPSSR